MDLEGKLADLMTQTQLDVIAFDPPATSQDAAARIRQSIDTVLDLAGESLVAVHAAIQQFGLAAIEHELGDKGPNVFKAYDAIVELVGEDWLGQENHGE